MKLYLSKIMDLKCGKFFHWKHIEKLQPKVKNERMEYGSTFHEVLSIYLKDGAKRAEEFIEMKGEDIMKQQLLALVGVFEKEGIERIVTTEKTMCVPIEGFEGWFFKPDFIFVNKKKELWIGELKTTASTALTKMMNFYMKSRQMSTYFYFVKKRFPQVKGIKIFLVNKGTKKNGPEVLVETLVGQGFNEKETEKFIEWAVSSIKKGINGEVNLFECYTFFGECPYYILCQAEINKKEKELELAKGFFETKDPDEHLFKS